MKTVTIEVELPTDADRVWAAMRHPASFHYVTRGLLGLPALAGRTEPWREGETATAWLLLFHVVPLSRHTMHLAEVDHAARTLRTREHGGPLRTWNHVLRVEPVDDRTCRYRDTVDIDAGPLTGLVAGIAVLFYRYRQRRWVRLVRRHLLPSGPAYATT